MLTDIVEKISVRKVDFEKVKANVRVNKYDNDRLEQYTRRENIRIFNFPTARGEPLTEAVVNLLNEMSSFRPQGQDSQEGLTPTHKFCAEEINVCHRTGGASAEGVPDSRPIIVRFLSRQSGFDVFKCKKKLRLMDNYKANRATGRKAVFITEDLMQLRVKMKDYVKSIEGVTNVFTTDGNIHCTKDNRHIVINNPDDLFKVITQPDWKTLNFNGLTYNVGQPGGWTNIMFKH